MTDGKKKTKVETQPLFSLDAFLPYHLSILTNRISRRFSERYQQAFGLSIAEWRVLAVLGSFAPLSSNAICQRTQMDKTKVSRAVSSLVSKDLIEREEDEQDQRLLRLNLSAKGLTVYQDIVPLAESLEEQLLSDFSAEEKVQLRQLMDRLQAAAEKLPGPE